MTAAPLPAPSSAPRPGTLPPRPSGGDHGHLWTLPDGTGLHAPLGQLVREELTGRVCCHLCGRWYRALGAHVRVHGYTAARYRETMGLCRTRALTAPEVSTAISARQAAAYRTDDALRERLRHGQQLARSGELVALTRGAVSAERSALRRAALKQGRRTAARRRDDDLRARLENLGAPSLASYVRQAYAAGASLDALGGATGLGRQRLRAAMTDAGITIRVRGATTLAGGRTRVDTADTAAARRVGTDDLHGWLRARRSEGATLTELAAAVGHSPHWVRWRLDDPHAVGNA